MDPHTEDPSDLAAMVMPQVGRLVATEDLWDPFQLIDPLGNPVQAVRVFFADLQASGRCKHSPPPQAAA